VLPVRFLHPARPWKPARTVSPGRAALERAAGGTGARHGAFRVGAGRRIRRAIEAADQSRRYPGTPPSSLLIAVRSESAPKAAKRRKRIRPPKHEKIYLAVHRHNNMLYYKRLDPEALVILTALSRGRNGRRCLRRSIIYDIIFIRNQRLTRNLNLS
jgi:hypothetical protein